jgi:hypothetical protein
MVTLSNYYDTQNIVIDCTNELNSIIYNTHQKKVTNDVMIDLDLNLIIKR